MHGVIPEALASDKLVIGNDRSEGDGAPKKYPVDIFSERARLRAGTAKVCTDEQVLQRENYLQGV